MIAPEIRYTSQNQQQHEQLRKKQGIRKNDAKRTNETIGIHIE